MHYSLMGKMRLPFIDSDLLLYSYIELTFKAGLTVHSFTNKQYKTYCIIAYKMYPRVIMQYFLIFTLVQDLFK